MSPMRDEQPNNEQLKIELLSQWKLEAESRNLLFRIRPTWLENKFLTKFKPKQLDIKPKYEVSDQSMLIYGA